MSTIEKLSIQGIRSFGPNSEDAQSITFSAPVTLILGKNGCGKTTIIECLKYALIGKIPPGGDGGKNFVHDPKIFRLTDALGQVKLLVRNINGEGLTVCRSMKLAVRKGKPTFETLECVMNYSKDDSNSVHSISKRANDVDTEMCQFIGVSRAIINNVLFCHQEDSSWPLDEPKKFKEKFDDIFGITDYNKAIEKIVKIRKELSANLKIKEAALPLQIHLKQEMDNKILNLQKSNSKKQNLEEAAQKINEEMLCVEDRLGQIRQIENSVGESRTQKVELETNKKNNAEQMNQIGEKIKKVYEGTHAELEDEILLFNEKIGKTKNDCADLEKKIDILKEKERETQNYLTKVDKKICIFHQNYQREQELCTKKSEKINKLGQELQIDFWDPNNSTLEQDIEKPLLDEERKISEMINTNENDDQKRQKELDQIRVDMAKNEETIIMLEKQQKIQKEEFLECDKKIMEINESSECSSKIDAKIKNTQELLEKLNIKSSQEERQRSINDAKNQISEKQAEFKSLDESLVKLSSYSKFTTEISLQENFIHKRQAEIRRLKSKHSDNFKKFFKTTLDNNFRKHLQEIYEKFRNDNKEQNEELNALKLKQQSHEIKRKTLKDEISQFEKDLENSKDVVFEACHSTPYESLIAKFKESIAKNQLEYGALTSSESIYKKYISKIEEDPHCPLCQKGLSENEAIDLKSELSDQIYNLPENINQLEKLLKSEQRRLDDLLQLKPTIDKIINIESVLPKKRQELKETQTKVAECIEQQESLQFMLAESNMNLDAVNGMFGDMTLLDEAIKDFTRANKEVENLKCKIPHNIDSTLSSEEIQFKKNKISCELEADRIRLDTIQQDYEKSMEMHNKLRDLKHSLLDQQMKIQQGLQNLPELKKRRNELELSSKNSSIEIIDLKNKLSKLKDSLISTANEKSKQKDMNKKLVIKMQHRLQSLQNIKNDIKRLNEELVSYQKQNLKSEITGLTEEIKQIKKDLDEITLEKNKMKKQLDELKEECSNKMMLERDLKDNLELKVLQQKDKDLIKKISQLTWELDNLEINRLTIEKRDLNKKKDDITVQRGEILGQIGETINQIKKLQTEMEESKFKNAVKNYKKTLFEVELLRLTASDLAQYRVAIEFSILQFHSEKMAKINRLIREYWRLIYKGNDIDYIEIQFNDGEDKIMTDQRRNFNYRVVQSKNNSQIEMRGRCSAGQRVLASLIIRMALAETFSNNCGVLALDEPTTNLDRSNIISLCEALNRIVEERHRETNFMLLIITHDEEFISALGKIDSYHHVFRNDSCKSVIRKVRIN